MIYIRKSGIFKDLRKRGILKKAFEFLDWYWEHTHFVPCPIRALCKECSTLKKTMTETEALYLIMDWQYRKESRNGSW